MNPFNVQQLTEISILRDEKTKELRGIDGGIWEVKGKEIIRMIGNSNEKIIEK